MDANSLIDALGGSAAVAAYIGAGQYAVANWRKRGVPAWAIPAMQRMCEEKSIDPGRALDPPRPRRIKARAA